MFAAVLEVVSVGAETVNDLVRLLAVVVVVTILVVAGWWLGDAETGMRGIEVIIVAGETVIVGFDEDSVPV